MELAGTVLAGFAGDDSNNWDQALLRLRAARSLLARSWRAARNVPGPEDPRAMARELTRRRFRRTETDAALADVARMASRAGDARMRDDALAVLVDRRAPEVKVLRAELAEAAQPQSAPAPFRMVSGRPLPYRPRDLDWPVLTMVLQAEGSR
jgi:hypothetical protein